MDEATTLRHQLADLADAHQRAEEKLRHEAIVLDNIGDAVVVTDERLFITLWNAAAERMYGWTTEETIGQPLLDLVGTQISATEFGAVMQRLAHVGSLHSQMTHRRKDGHLIEVEATTVALHHAAGRITGYVAVLRDIRNITERKRAEDQLQASGERYRELLESAPIAIGVTSGEGAILFHNQAMLDIYGYDSADDFFNSPLTDRYADPADRQRLMELLERGLVQDFETRFRRRDGTISWGSVSAVRHEVGPEQYQIIVTILDVTRRRQTTEDLRRMTEQLQQALDGTIRTMSMIVEQKDPYTAGHQRRVAALATTIARELGLSADRVEGLRVAGLLHDIGKIYVPAEILSKPGALTENEFNMIKVHPQAAYDTLKGIEFPWPVADIALQHHERLDGSGYPAGLSGDAILLEGRILAIADVVEAMASHRPYRPARGVEAALAEIAQNRGALYDADAVDACLRLFNEQRFRFE